MNRSFNEGTPSRPQAVSFFRAESCVLLPFSFTLRLPAAHRDSLANKRALSTAILPSPGGVNADQLLKPNTICTSSLLFTSSASLWENAEQCVFYQRARQGGLCAGLVYSWIESVPEIKAVLSQSFGSPVPGPLSRLKPTCTSSSER